jgi:hypothetical protein
MPSGHPFSRRVFTGGLFGTLGLATSAGLQAADPALAPPPGPPQPTPKPGGRVARVANLYTRTVWSDGRHNGFPGIALFGGHYYVTCRNAESHKDEKSKIVVVRSPADDLAKWEQVGEFKNDHDARDPLLFVVGDKLRLVWHSKEDWTSDTADGKSWSPQTLLDTEVVEPKPDSGLVLTSRRRWLFRIRRGPDGAFYSLARCGIKQDGPGTFGLILYRSTDGFTFKAMHGYGEGPTRALSQGGGVGWGHEADLAFRPDGTMVCAIRNGGPGVLVSAPAPYTTWTALPKIDWPDFGGPSIYTTAGGGMLVAARETPRPRPAGTYPARLVVRTVTPEGIIDPFYVPASGDCGYSSFAPGRTPEEVLLCYYSSHEYRQPKGTGENPANIYLAHLTIRHYDA